MKLLILTNLYPPQELGGYGRCMADFAWGLRERGHQVEVLTSNTPHLGPSSSEGPSGEAVYRRLKLKGSYEGGIKPTVDKGELQKIGEANSSTIKEIWERSGPYDGVLVGNIDLLGVEVINTLPENGVPILHHIGFVNAPFYPNQKPRNHGYQLIAASKAVRYALQQAGLENENSKMEEEKIAVVYPGVRSELFGMKPTGRSLPEPLNGKNENLKLGSIRSPLKVCFAGLLMGSKGAHTLIDALVNLKRRGINVEGHIAGGSFQAGYRERLEKILEENRIDCVNFTGQLSRQSLARLFRLHHVCVFPSIHPEAFGIVGAEAMASGIALISSGVGGAVELFEDNESGILFEAGNADAIAEKLYELCNNPSRLRQIAQKGEEHAREKLSVFESTRQIELLFKQKNEKLQKSIRIF